LKHDPFFKKNQWVLYGTNASNPENDFCYRFTGAIYNRRISFFLSITHGIANQKLPQRHFPPILDFQE
jgi:hypothetical protein